jgi:hypothetical protein
MRLHSPEAFLVPRVNGQSIPCSRPKPVKMHSNWLVLRQQEEIPKPGKTLTDTSERGSWTAPSIFRQFFELLPILTASTSGPEINMETNITELNTDKFIALF